MITLIADSRHFLVEFRHQRTARRFLEISSRAPIQAITTCVIIALEQGELEPSAIEFVAMGTAVCLKGDNFSRREGRLRSFSKAVRDCGALNGCKVALLAAYMEQDSDPPAREKTPKLTDAEKTDRWETGWQKRKQREARRAQGARS